MTTLDSNSGLYNFKDKVFTTLPMFPLQKNHQKRLHFQPSPGLK